ncbi:aminoglycoside phosphotransferase family protein [Vibrio mangrovi]|uniref:Capsular biosynthesis protein n=1 Tax=Vibrio mangrovi TaxID=474394 RepID=A0A1Y6IV52_9VIBR|nr:capsular biosynthesis protein [Vibrio mangrovi]MDW6002200.1 capsular biosynthesis protein [Vibrio mangrovi]SMS01545.1 hypothetical protein VIM7927_02841 [Vibrio mangrovi]
MFLIMSAAYVGQELESEFGRLPPSFLPLGNQRLFKHQINSIPENYEIYLSIPESYDVTECDIKWLDKHDIHIIKTPDNLTLGASLVAALNLSEQGLDKDLHILFGDTLIPELSEFVNFHNDIIGVSTIKENYNWTELQGNKIQWIDIKNDKLTDKVIVNGYFKISKPRAFVKAITKSHWDFIDGLNLYQNDNNVKEVLVNKWLDFGHVNTYYQSKSEFTTQRAFNDLSICQDWIEKSSAKNIKIKAEANWFKSIPDEMKIFIPQFLGDNDTRGEYSYRLEYLYYTALNELYVFSLLPEIKWEQIIDSCLSFIKLCRDYNYNGASINSLKNLFGEKTLERVNEFCADKKIDTFTKWNFNGEKISIDDLIYLSNKYLPQDEEITLLHGDFCFSNILYDFRSQRIKVIDPRGITPSNDFSIYGDYRYDLAKLSHSIIGLYDRIIAGYYSIDINYNSHDIQFSLDGERYYLAIQQIFVDKINKYFNLNEMNLLAMQIHLFISMLPLHADDHLRQDALFANAFRLYQKMKEFEI